MCQVRSLLVSFSFSICPDMCWHQHSSKHMGSMLNNVRWDEDGQRTSASSKATQSSMFSRLPAVSWSPSLPLPLTVQPHCPASPSSLAGPSMSWINTKWQDSRACRRCVCVRLFACVYCKCVNVRLGISQGYESPLSSPSSCLSPVCSSSILIGGLHQYRRQT